MSSFNDENFDSIFQDGTPYILDENLKISTWLNELAEKEAVTNHDDEVFNVESLGELEGRGIDHQYVGEEVDEDLGQWIPVGTKFSRADYINDESSRNIINIVKKISNDEITKIKQAEKEKQEIFKQTRLSKNENKVLRYEAEIDSGNDLKKLSSEQNEKQKNAEKYNPDMLAKLAEQQDKRKYNVILGRKDNELKEISKKMIYSGVKKENLFIQLSKNFGKDRISAFLEASNDIIDRYVNEVNNTKNSNVTHLKNVGAKIKEIRKEKETFRYASKIKKEAYYGLIDGKPFNQVKNDLEEKYGASEFNNFYSNEGKDIKVLEHKIGNLFLDSNIYNNCDEMTKHANQFDSRGILLLKKNPGCYGCLMNNNNICNKTHMFLVNNPLNMGPIDSKRLVNSIKGLGLVDTNIIDGYARQINNNSNNLPIIKMMLKDVKEAMKLAADPSKAASKGKIKQDGSDVRNIFSKDEYDVNSIFKDENDLENFDIILGEM